MLARRDLVGLFKKRSHQPHGNCRPIVVKDLSCCNLHFMLVLLELRQSGAARLGFQELGFQEAVEA
jgi:hypothetical protein